jgi:hypothetical protein
LSRPLAEARKETSIGQVTGAERRKNLCNFVLSNSLAKKRSNNAARASARGNCEREFPAEKLALPNVID